MAQTQCVDVSGNSRHGSFIECPELVPGALAGSANQGTYFRRSEQQYVNIDVVVPAVIGGPFTLGCWCKPQDTWVGGGGGQPLLAFNGGSLVANQNTVRLVWSHSAAVQRFAVADATIGGGSDEPVGASANTFGLDAWHFVTASHDGTTFRLMVNGTLQREWASTDLVDSGDRCSIGQEWDGAADTDHFDGPIDEAFVLDRILSLAEHQNLYSIGTGSAPGSFREAVLALDPVAYYRLADTCGGFVVGRVSVGSTAGVA